MALRYIIAVRAKKVRLAAHLAEHERHLRQGLWFLWEPRTAKHVSVGTLPGSLLSTKSVKRIHPRSLKSFVRRMLYRVVPPFVAYIRHGKGRDGSKSSCIDFPIFVTAKSGDAILINCHDRAVVRISKVRRFDQNKLDIRQRIGRYFILPKIEVVGDGKVIKEMYLDGRSFVNIDVSERHLVADQILQRYTRLITDEGELPPDGFWEESLTYASTLRLPDSAREWIDFVRGDLHEAMGHLAFTPAHGDLSSDNILVTNQGPGLIDLEDCAFLPAYFDLFFLCYHELLAGRSDLWRHFIVGDGWEGIDQGLRCPKICKMRPNRKIWLASMFFVECFLWRRKVGVEELDEPELAKRWQPVLQALSQ